MTVGELRHILNSAAEDTEVCMYDETAKGMYRDIEKVTVDPLGVMIW
jgi:hypothetical protein